jgi:hypothetical protein
LPPVIGGETCEEPPALEADAWDNARFEHLIDGVAADG